MKRSFLLTCLLLSFVLFSSPLFGFKPYINVVKDGPISTTTISPEIMFGIEDYTAPASAVHYGSLAYLGYYLSFYVHELGHQIVGDASGGKQRWVGFWPGQIQGYYYGSKKEQMGVAGFMFMNCYSEIMMNINPRSPLTIGVVVFNLIHNFGYIIKDNKGQLPLGDFSNFQKPGERDLIKRLVFAHTAWVGLRLIMGKKMSYLPTIEIRNGVPFYMYYWKF